MFLNIDKQEKEKVAILDNEGARITYGELVEFVKNVGSRVEARTVIFMLCKNTAGSVIGYLGFINQEAVPVTLNSKIDKDLLNNLLNTYCPAYLWIPKEEVNNFSYKPVFELFDYVLLKTDYQIYPINEKLQLLMTTSGSTGSPKLVRYKKGNLEANARNVATAFGWTKEERPICDLGMQYTMGLNVINTHLYVGATLLLTTYNLISSEFWEYIRENRATNFTGVPFSYDIFHRLRFERMDLPYLKTLSQGGGKLTDERFKQLAEYAERTGKRFIASFGTTETSARMACLPSSLALKKIGSIGRAIPEGELFLIDGSGEIIKDLVAEGEMCYKGPNVTMGYALCKEDLLKDDEFNGIYHTGDLARRDEDGCYYVTGRLSRFLKLLSYRISLDQTERMIQQKFGIECACAGTDQRMNIYVTDATKSVQIVDYLSDTLGLFKSLFKVFVIDKILRNDTGKIQYKKLDEIYAENNER